MGQGIGLPERGGECIQPVGGAAAISTGLGGLSQAIVALRHGRMQAPAGERDLARVIQGLRV